MRVAAHSHRDDLDERRAKSRAGAVDRPSKRSGRRVGIGAIDGQAGHAVSRRFVRKHARGSLLGQAGQADLQQRGL